MSTKWIGLLFGVVLLLAACGGSERPPGGAGAPREEIPKVVRVVASEYAYSMPTEIEGGVVSLELVNEGADHHEFAFGRLEEGTEV
jgi:hypothetical protein